MTRLVKFTKDMRPHSAGDTRAVPDDVADRLAKDGEAEIVESVFDSGRAGRKQRYPTRKGT